jgi:hypothetical protein
MKDLQCTFLNNLEKFNAQTRFFQLLLHGSKHQLVGLNCAILKKISRARERKNVLQFQSD